jgi:hypothetical protein
MEYWNAGKWNVDFKVGRTLFAVRHPFQLSNFAIALLPSSQQPSQDVSAMGALRSHMQTSRALACARPVCEAAPFYFVPLAVRTQRKPMEP